MAEDERRLDEALQSLESVEPVRRWDDVVARASSGVTPLATAPVRGRRTARWLLAAAAVVVMAMAAGSAALSLRDEDDGEPLEVGGAPTTAPTSVIRTPCGRIAVDGDVGWFAYAPVEPQASVPEPDDLRSFTIDGVSVRTPGDVVIDFVGERAEGVETAHGTAIAWYRTDGVLELRITPPWATPECPVVSIEVTGDDDAADLATAIRIANELRFVDAAETEPSPAENTTCEGLSLASTSVPPGFSLSLAADGTFEGEGQAVEVRWVAPSGSSDVIRTATIPWAFGTTEVDGLPAIEAAVTTDCSALLIGHGGVTVEQLRDLLTAAYLVTLDRLPVLDPGVLWPWTAQGRVPRGLGPQDALTPGQGTAVQFAQVVLGWPDAVAGGSEPAHRGPHALDVLVRRGPGDETAIVVTVDRAVGARWWAVVEVGPVAPSEDEQGLGVSVAGTVARASSPLVDNAASATVRFDYGGRVAEGRIDEATELGFAPDTTGSVIVLFHDLEGNVVSAKGAALPAGDFAAG